MTAGMERYLSERLGQTVQLKDVRRMVGGAARTTWRSTAVGPHVHRGIVFRVHGVDEGELHLSSDRSEFTVNKAAFDAGIPVPEPMFFEEDERWIGTGFAVLAEVPDSSVSTDSFTTAERERLAEDCWSILGRIAALDTVALRLDDVLAPAQPDRTARIELDRWIGTYRASLLHPDPIGEAAIRWMEAGMPPPAQKLSLVHGDYRVGNLLFGRPAQVMAVLDWEMTHLGDPLEDLAWSLDPRQDVDRAESAGGLAPYDQAVRLWQQASGLSIDPEAFRWWQVFSAFKALAIWTKAASLFARGSAKRPALARMGWVLVERQQRVLADYLSPASAHRLFEYRP